MFFLSSRRRHTSCALVTGFRRVLFRSFGVDHPSVAGKTRAKAGTAATGFGAPDVLLLRRGSGRALRDFPCADGLARHILLLTQRFVISDAFLTIEEARALEALAERRKGIVGRRARERHRFVDRKSTRLNSSH